MCKEKHRSTVKSVFFTVLCFKLGFSPLENNFTHLPCIWLRWAPATQQEPKIGQTKLRVWLTVAPWSKLRGYDWSCGLVQAVFVHTRRRTCCAVVAYLASLPYYDAGLHWVSKGQQAHFPVKMKNYTYLCLLKAHMDFSWPSPAEDDQNFATALSTPQGSSGVHLCETTVWRDEVEPTPQSCL